jgi:hypothetical protein
VVDLNQRPELRAVSESRRLFGWILWEIVKAAATLLASVPVSGTIRLLVLDLLADALPFLEGQLR